MIRRSAVIVVALLLLTIAAWSLVPPFPSPGTLLASPSSKMEERLGAPTVGAAARAPSETWEVSRGITVWSLHAYWKASAGPNRGLPHRVERCVRLRLTPEE